MSNSLPISQRARDVVKGGFDLHVHSGPDVMKRIGSDLQIARAFEAQGLGGYVIKHHYSETGGRAALAREAVPAVKTMGSITLNAAVGGMNALAVEMASRDGISVVWFPTVDAENEAKQLHEYAPGVPPPQWVRLQNELKEEGLLKGTISVVDADGRLLPDTVEVIKNIAKNDLILATGHLGRDEIFAVVDEAVAQGVKRIVITHPEFPTQDISLDDQRLLAERGAMLERCFVTYHSGKYPWQQMFENVRETGIENSFFSTDLGQPKNPPVEDGLALMADKAFEGGFTDDEVHQLCVVNPARLAEGAGKYV
ncbi:MAG: cytosolic protein [Anaerolineae bacterium]|nr:cytosolic protein [Anaerolineae bacterium]